MATDAKGSAAEAEPPRSCGDCRLCCKVLAVDAIGKPARVWCEHSKAGIGCTIYDDRPAACRTFRCLWLDRLELGDQWQPHLSHFVLYLDGPQLVVNVDSEHPGAWRRQPYRDAIRAWAARGLTEGLQIVVKTGRQVTAILPDQEIDLGEVADDEYIKLSRVRTPEGVRLVAQKLPVG
jgi:hypothetical protein